MGADLLTRPTHTQRPGHSACPSTSEHIPPSCWAEVPMIGKQEVSRGHPTWQLEFLEVELNQEPLA